MRTDWSIRAVERLENDEQLLRKMKKAAPEDLESIVRPKMVELDPDCHKISNEAHMTEIIVDVDKIPNDVEFIRLRIYTY